MAGSSHGHTPAAWTGVSITFVGFCIGAVFVVAENPVGFWAGIAVILLGAVVGFVMKNLGLGTPKDTPAMAQARQQASLAQSEAPVTTSQKQPEAQTQTT